MFKFLKKSEIKPRKYHWYEVRYVYNNKKGQKQFDYVSQIGLTHQKETLNRRELKKITKPLHKESKVKNVLVNGFFNVEIMCYLGYFSK